MKLKKQNNILVFHGNHSCFMDVYFSTVSSSVCLPPSPLLFLFVCVCVCVCVCVRAQDSSKWCMSVCVWVCVCVQVSSNGFMSVCLCKVVNLDFCVRVFR